MPASFFVQCINYDNSLSLFYWWMCFVYICLLFFFWYIDCELYAIGKPVYHKFSEEHYGSALKDPLPRNEMIAEKYWCTKQNESKRLYEYANKNTYRSNSYIKMYGLERPFRVSWSFVAIYHFIVYIFFILLLVYWNTWMKIFCLKNLSYDVILPSPMDVFWYVTI